MKNTNNKIIIGLAVAVLILIAILSLPAKKPIVVNPTPVNVAAPVVNLGSQVMSSTTLVRAFKSNYASVSFSSDDDIISYSIDAPTVASVSVGEIIMFKGGTLEPTGVTANYPYYVFTASTSAGFEIASSSDSDTALDIQAAGEGAEFFYELPSAKNGDTPLIDVSNGKYTTITVDCQDSTVSSSWAFIGSIQDLQPNIYASQSYTNRWDKVYVNDTNSGTGIAGSTGVEITSADHRMFRLYPETLKWFGIRFTDMVAGTCTVKAAQND